MSLIPGARLGPYTIAAPLGAGGMGEVYRARDSRLDRDVAIKVLRADVASDRERLARFDREARLLAALNHPNIANVIGLEGADDAPALIMELVEGPTLALRIDAGALPLDEALEIARQIAEALEAAHERGIVHRDLKPGNVKVRADGLVKVLDFGLAKALDPTDAPGVASLADSPTITSPAMTARGVILGTAAYMAPEQAKGRPVDRRADIWACGCVLYEMLTGRRAFQADDTAETLAAVLSKEPDGAAASNPGVDSAAVAADAGEEPEAAHRLGGRRAARGRRGRLRPRERCNGSGCGGSGGAARPYAAAVDSSGLGGNGRRRDACGMGAMAIGFDRARNPAGRRHPVRRRGHGRSCTFRATASARTTSTSASSVTTARGVPRSRSPS